ncbi:MAG: DUF4167 domain-containing protein [Pseudomonadota bacterium]
MKRQRGRGRRSGGGGNNPNRHFESNGPDVKIRGSAQQVLDKYLQYARDAHTSGDRVMSEAYFQHAEHYLRLVAAMQPKEKPRREREEGESEETQSQDNETTEAKETAPTKDDTPPQDEAQPSDKPRRRRERAPRETVEKDPLEVVDADASDTSATPAEPEAAEDAPKPRRRRTYKKKDAEPAADSSDEVDDGVMATLSRGHSKPDADAAGNDTSEGVDTPAK